MVSIKRLALLLLLPFAFVSLALGATAIAHTQTRSVVGVRTRAVAKAGLRVGTVITAPRRGPKGQRILRYQWELCNTKGARCSKIRGATKRSYRVVTADLKHTLRVAMVVPAGGGQTTVTSAATPEVVLPLPVNTVIPTITGCGGSGLACTGSGALDPTVGETLTATQGTWTGAVSFSDQWDDCNSTGTACTAIAGATSLTYTLQSADAGDSIVFVSTAYNYAGG